MSGPSAPRRAAAELVAAARARREQGARPVPGGTRFSVWAPRAGAVRLCLDAGRATHAMAPVDGSGVWRTDVPGVRPGRRYAFEIEGADGVVRRKADPMAAEVDPDAHDRSVVAASTHRWTDDAWLAGRAARAAAASPLSVYEVHAGSWQPGLGYRELAPRLADEVRALGFTHVELLPLTAHPFAGSWGYQVTSYFAPDPRGGRPDDLRHLVDHLHGEGIGVILDWVPGHFPRDDWALARFDGTALFEHPDPRRGVQPEWDTLVFDYGRAEVRDFLVASALAWVEEFHADGLRVDAVSSMLYRDFGRVAGGWEPNDDGGRENLEAVVFCQELNDALHAAHPDVLTVAEEATAWPGVTAQDGPLALGFDLKWSLGWSHDLLAYFATDPAERPAHDELLGRPDTYAWDERAVLPLSHDDVVHGRGSLWAQQPGPDDAARAASLRALLALQWAHPGRKLLFMGGEFGDPREWSHESGPDRSVTGRPVHAGLRRLVADLNAAYRDRPALHRGDDDPAAFTRLTAAAGVSVFARDPGCGVDDAVVVLANLSAEPAEVGVRLPRAGSWSVLLDTADPRYGGAGAPARGPVAAGAGAEVAVALDPDQVVWLVPQCAGVGR